MLAILIINYRTVAATRACLAALVPVMPPGARIYLLDNGSGAAEAAELTACANAYADKVYFDSSAANLGFAAGMNRLLARALSDPANEQVLLLNSDTRPTSGFVAAMQARIDMDARVEMIAAKLLNTENGTVDSLGIALYRSTLASNRKREDEVLLGPTGGCALFSRRLLDDLHASHGEWFDESFFCYAEDTDLVLRARWLGYRAAFAADATVHHAGSLSSGGPDNDFVLYHGIRNSLWWLAKDAPSAWLLRSLPWFILLHGGIWLRHLRRGRGRVLWRLYRDAIKGLPAMRKKRALVRATRRVALCEFAHWVEPHFYERNYVRRAWRELWFGR